MMKIKNLLYAVGGLLVTTLPTKTFAAPFISSTLEADIGKTGLGTNSPTTIVGNVLNVALSFLALVALGLFLWAGFTWMTAAGNEDKIKTAKSTLAAAAIGLVIVLASWGITLYLFGTIGSATGSGAQ